VEVRLASSVVTDSSLRFPIRFTGANRSLRFIGITPSGSYVTVDDDVLRVRLGWTFKASLDRASVQSAALDHGPVGGWGAHGWNGHWLVNGSSSGLVRIEFEPAGHGSLLLVWPVKLRVLRVSVEDPEGLVAHLAPPS